MGPYHNLPSAIEPKLLWCRRTRSVCYIEYSLSRWNGILSLLNEKNCVLSI
jgi:hypothetical protein